MLVIQAIGLGATRPISRLYVCRTVASSRLMFMRPLRDSFSSLSHFRRLWLYCATARIFGRIGRQGVNHLAGPRVMQFFAGLVFDCVGIVLQPFDVALHSGVFKLEAV